MAHLKQRLLVAVLIPIFFFNTRVLGQLPPTRSSVAFVNVSIVDVANGQLLPNQTVLIQGERIVSVGTSATMKIPKGTKIIKSKGKFVLPGFWDMHTHLSWATESALPLLIANGVTGVRDMGGKLTEIDEWRAQIESGSRVGPRIVRVGPMVNGQQFNQYQIAVANANEARGLVRGLKAAGVDFIKIHRRVPRDAYFAIIDEAKKLSLRVIGHVPLEVTTAEAAEAGQASIEHTETLFESTVVAGELLELNGPSIHKYLSEHGAQLFAKLATEKTFFTPTLSPWKAEIRARDGSPPDPNLRYVAASLRKAPVAPMNLPLSGIYAAFCDAVRQMHNSGVVLMVGTDTSAPPRVAGFLLHDELKSLVECGLSPVEALRSATVVPAQFLGQLNDFGAVQAGKMADIILLNGNPLADIGETRSIWAVVAGGRVFQQKDLGGLLQSAENLANSK